MKGFTRRTGRTPLVFALLLLGGVLLAGGGLSSQGPNDDFRFRPDHERENLSQDTAYRKWQAREGLPVHTGVAANAYEVKMGPWKRLGPGVSGAYLNLDGAEALVDVINLELAPGAKTTPERHLYEEQFIVVRGQGETHIWQSDPAKKVVVPWRRGTVFSPPLNTFHQHINTGKEPARMTGVTDLPLKIDIFRNPDFIYNTNYNFTDRYAGQADYFDPEKSIDYSPKTAHSLSIVNLIRDAWTWRLFHAGQGYSDIDRHFILSDNNMAGHIEAWAIGAYQRAHRHGPSLVILHMGGPGYSLMWPPELGLTPWKDGKGDKVTYVEWKEGTVLIPPTQWYHQHFATAAKDAKFIMLGSGMQSNAVHPITTGVLRGNSEGHMIQFKDEDPYIRQRFEKELAKTGAKILMPPMAELIALEKAADGGRIPLVEGSTVQ